MREIYVMKYLKGHPNVVSLLAHTILDMGRTKEAFLVMEFCEKSLVNVLERRGAGYFEEKQVLTIFRDVCNAIFAMHCQSPPVANRDLKAENLLLGADRSWKLCDFKERFQQIISALKCLRKWALKKTTLETSLEASIFDPDTQGHAQKLKEMDPINFETGTVLSSSDMKAQALISAASVGIKACFGVIGEIMPPKREPNERIEENRSVVRSTYGSYPPLREDGLRSSRETEGLPSRIERVRALGFGGLAQTFSHSKQGGYQLSSEESSRGFASSRAGKRSAEEESGFRPSALRGGDEKYYARGGRATKGSFNQRDWRGGHGSEQGRQHDVTVRTPLHEFDDSGSKATLRKRLVKKSGDREKTPDFGIEDEEPAFMRDEFASEPPSSQKWKGSKEDGFRKKEKKLKGDKKFDKGWKMSSKGGSLPGGRADGDNEGFIGDAPQLEKGHGTRESLDILLGKAVSYNPQAEVLWLRGAKEKWLAGEVDTARAILGQAYAAITNSKEILLAAIQTESRHGNKKESDILMARQKTLFVGCKRFTNLSKLTCRRLPTSTRIQSGAKINVKHLVPYYGDTSDDDNSRANFVHPGENDEVQELACKFLIG
ncbi:hypothetical protein Syun_016029 [Stephania yunnanensis]|uniref:non-specific serine/threonine protein kinase n=1 Tax=Stephania yunnanensis TaxID=152371 RepID=A0AAP0J6M7_9MAGN